MNLHLTAHLDFGSPPLRGPSAAALWRSLRRAFPDALGATLMPDHLHLITPAACPVIARRTVMGIAGRHRRAFGSPGRGRGPGSWRVAPPVAIPDRRHLARQIRYVALNPCRSSLAPDPLAWMWSTHRDVLGATVDPWVDARRLAVALGRPLRDFPARHHAYVSGDPSTAVAGTPTPRIAPVYAGALRTVAAAACAAARYVDPADARARRRAVATFHALARAIRIPWTRALEVTGLPYSTAQDAARRTSPRALRAALLCLSDVRLRRPRDVASFPSLRRPTKRPGSRPRAAP